MNSLWHSVSGAAGGIRALIAFWMATVAFSFLAMAGAFTWQVRHQGIVSESTEYVLISPVVGIFVSIWLYRRTLAAQMIVRLLMAVGMAIVVSLAVFGFVLWVKILGDSVPFFTALFVLLQLGGIALGVALFSVLWGFRGVAISLFRLLTNPHRTRQLSGLVRGALGGALVAVVASIITILAGAGSALMTTHHLFYSVAVPALAGFGWFVPVTTAPSKLFAILSLWGAFSIAVATFPIPFIEPYSLTCRGDEAGVHSFLGFEGAPWRWDKHPVAVATQGPATLAALTILNVVDPRPEC